MPAPVPVTVIVRTHNRPTLLDQALGSLARQVCPPERVLVVNDGGCDVADVLLAHTDLHIDLVTLNPGRGRSEAANIGLDRLETPFGLFLDDDDWLEPDHLARLYERLSQAPQAVAAYSGVVGIHEDPDGNRTRGHVFNAPFDRLRLLTENFIPIHAVLFRSDVVRDNGLRLDKRFAEYEDWDFWLRLSAFGEFLHIDAITAAYRIAGDGGFGIRRDNPREAAALVQFFRLWRDRWSDEDVVAIAQAAKHRSMYHELRALLARQDEELHRFIDERDDLSRALNRADDELVRLNDAHSRLAEHAEDLNEKVDYLVYANGRAEAELQRLRDQLDALLHSTSWRLTRPLRGAVRLARALRHRLPSYSRKSLAILREGGPAELARRAQAKLGRRPPEERLERRYAVAEQCAPISLPVVSTPAVTVWVHADAPPMQVYTAIAALVDAGPGEPWELLVTVPTGAEGVAAMLGSIQGVRVCDVAADGGWNNALQAVATQARGSRVLVLSAYSVVLPGTLERLVATLSKSPGTWLVSPRLITPEGRLRAAGCILWRSGALSRYGDGDDPAHPQYRFVRPLDGVGADAALADLGTLRRLLRPGSAEVAADYALTGLVLRAQDENLRALYQPDARVVVLAGGDLTPERREASRGALKSAWRQRLSQQAAVGSDPQRARDRVRKRVLIIDVITPLDDQDSGSLRMVRLMQELQGLGCHITFLPTNVEFNPPYTARLQQMGIEMLYAPQVWSMERYLETQGAGFDAIIVSRLIAADAILPMVRHLVPGARLIYDTVDLHYLREERAAKLSGSADDLATAKATQARELGHMQLADLTWVVSPVEREILAKTLPSARVEVLTNIHEPHPAERPFAERHGLVFIGGFNHPPNEDAMLWFAADIWPRIIDRLPGVTLYIVGSRPTRAIQALADAHIKVTGFVEDITPYFEQCRLSIAPLRYGAGVKGKINTAMAYGLPVVATSPAAEGMWLTHEADVLMADDAAGFAEAIVRAYSDEALWTRLVAGGLENIRRYFSRERAREALARALDLT